MFTTLIRYYLLLTQNTIVYHNRKCFIMEAQILFMGWVKCVDKGLSKLPATFLQYSLALELSNGPNISLMSVTN